MIIYASFYADILFFFIFLFLILHKYTSPHIQAQP